MAGGFWRSANDAVRGPRGSLAYRAAGLGPAMSALRLLVTVGVLLGVLASVPAVASAESLCTDTWTGASEGEWATASNWSAGHVPGSSDVACVGSGKTVKVFSAAVAGVVQGEGSVSLVSGSLEVSNALEPSVIHALSLTGGTLTGAATVDVSGSLTWEGGAMAGSGETILQPGATATMSNVYIEGSRLVVNEGTATFGSNTFTMSETAVFKNVGTFKANSEASPPAFRVGTGTPKIVNTGVFEKTAGELRSHDSINDVVQPRIPNVYRHLPAQSRQLFSRDSLGRKSGSRSKTKGRSTP